MAHALALGLLPPPDERCWPLLPRDDGLTDNLLLVLALLRIAVSPVVRTDAANSIASRKSPPSLYIMSEYTSPLTPQP